MVKRELLRKILVLLSFLGMLATAYLVYQHFRPAGTGFCNVSDYVSCDVVNKSKYAEIFGIPVSALGFLAYVILFFGFLGMVKRWHFEKISRRLHEGAVLFLLTLFAGFSLAFSLVLTYIEFFILEAVCLFCVTQQILILLIFVILVRLWLEKQKSSV